MNSSEVCTKDIRWVKVVYMIWWPVVGGSGSRQDDGRCWKAQDNHYEGKDNDKHCWCSENTQAMIIYQRRPSWTFIILAGETDCGGLERAPVNGLTIGMALRILVAAGWWSFSCVGWLWYDGTYGWEVEEREKVELETSTWRDWGLDSGDPLANEERSDEAELMDIWSSSVRRFGQNSRSSSRSKDRCASKRVRKEVSTAASSSFLTLRNCLWEFCDTRGARRPRPLWCEEFEEAFDDAGWKWALWL